MNRELLKSILSSQKQDIQNQDRSGLIEREESFQKYLSDPEITVITGVRRSGKSTTLEELLLSEAIFEKAIYVNFEDPRLGEFKAEDFQDIYEIWYAENQTAEKRIAIFDEVQNIEGWEPWMNFFAKQKQFKVFVTGSNSKMLSKELGTHLTGRIRTIAYYPLSFKEILNHERQAGRINFDPAMTLTTEQSISLQKLTAQYLELGGFPRAWEMKNTQILSEYYQNIIERDIIRRKKIKNYLVFEKFASTVMAEIGRTINKSKIAKLCGLKDADTIDKYINFLEESYLGFQIRKYDSSIRKQLRNQPKFYAIDSALARRISPPSDSRETFLLENIVLIELLRRGCKVYYWKGEESGEIDFVAETPQHERILLQVCWSLENSETLSREVTAFKAFKSAYPKLKISQKVIITMLEEFVEVPKDVQVIPYFRWACQ